VRLPAAVLLMLSAMLAPAVAASAARAQTPADLRVAATPAERAALRCPPADAAGDFASPTRQYPSADVPLWQDFSDDTDLVLIAGADGESTIDLGAGDDIALVHDAEGGGWIDGAEGADTVLVCSLADLSLVVDVGVDGADADVVVVETGVFVDVPAGMVRDLHVTLDSPDDRMVVHHPATAAVDVRVQQSHVSGRIGDVVFTVVSPDPGAALVLAVDFSAGAGFDADALLAEWRGRGCRMKAADVVAFVEGLGGSSDAAAAYAAGLLAAGAALPDGEDDLLLVGVDGCPARDARAFEAARWTGNAAAAEVASRDGTFRLVCGPDDAVMLELFVPGAVDGPATISVDGKDTTDVAVTCDAASAVCVGDAPLAAPDLVAALRLGAAVAVGGVVAEPVAFPLAGSSRAIGALACTGG